jgi:hypothetical protein
LAATLPMREASLTLTIDACLLGVATTRRSINGLRRMVDCIGLA